MKLKNIPFGRLLGMVICLGSVSGLRGQTATWNSSTTGNWTDVTKWNWTGTAPGTALPDATTNMVLTNGGTVQLAGSSQKVLALTMNNGRLEILGGAGASVLQPGAAVVFGSAAGSNTSLLVDGLGSEFLKTDATQIHIGSAGTATATISNQAKMSVVSTVHVGLGSASGTTGVGILNINTGGQFVSTSTFILGYRGNGTMNIESGGYAKTPNGFIAGYGQDANRVQGTGAVKVSGAGSKWDVGAIYVGHTGTGALLIEDGGLVASTSIGSIGFYNAGVSSSNPTAPAAPTKYGTGTVTVQTGGLWLSAGALSVGASGATGTLNLSSLGQVNVGGGSGIITLGAAGTLNIGGVPSVDGLALAPGIVNAGSITGNTATGRTMNLFHNDFTGNYALTKNGTLGGEPVALAGSVRLNVLSGSTTLAGTNSFTGGTTIGGRTDTSARLVIRHAAALGTGALRVKAGGILEVAPDLPFVMVDDNLTLEGGSALAFKLEPGGSWAPRFEVTGWVNFLADPSNKIKIYLSGEEAVSNPALYDWTFLSSVGGLYADPADLFEVVSNVPGFYVFQRDDSLVLGMSVAPEPGRLLLCLGGLACLGLRRRR